MPGLAGLQRGVAEHAHRHRGIRGHVTVGVHVDQAVVPTVAEHLGPRVVEGHHLEEHHGRGGVAGGEGVAGPHVLHPHAQLLAREVSVGLQLDLGRGAHELHVAAAGEGVAVQREAHRSLRRGPALVGGHVAALAGLALGRPGAARPLGVGPVDGQGVGGPQRHVTGAAQIGGLVQGRVGGLVVGRDGGRHPRGRGVGLAGQRTALGPGGVPADHAGGVVGVGLRGGVAHVAVDPLLADLARQLEIGLGPHHRQRSVTVQALRHVLGRRPADVERRLVEVDEEVGELGGLAHPRLEPLRVVLGVAGPAGGGRAEGARVGVPARARVLERRGPAGVRASEAHVAHHQQQQERAADDGPAGPAIAPAGAEIELR